MPKKQLTPEEKEQLKIEKREKKKLAQIQKKLKLRHDELSREIKYCKLTTKNHERNWKKLLIRISLPKIREELIYVWQALERLLDIKDFTISLHMDELQCAEEQYLRNLKEHLISFDKYLSKYRDVLEDMQCMYDRDVKELQDQVQQEMDHVNEVYVNDEMLFKVNLYGLLKIRRDQEKLIKGDRVSKLDEEISRMTDLTTVMQATKIETLQALIIDYMNVITNYHIETREKRDTFLKLYENDKELKRITKENAEKIIKMQERLRHKKDSFETKRKTNKLKISRLKMEKDYFKTAFDELTKIMKQQNKKIIRKMVHMTTSFNVFLDLLQKFEKKGEYILTMVMMCSKLETIYERILPFPLEQPCLTKKQDKKFRAEFEDYEPNLYAIFWGKLAKASDSLTHLNFEKAYLLAENEELSKRINELCQCVECPAILVPPDSRHGVIDARHELRKYNLHHK